MSRSYVDEVTRFREALDLAVHDRELDVSGNPQAFFFDADVVIDVIVGLTAWNPSSRLPDVSDWSYSVKALLSTGYLPRIRMLTPHLVELDRFIGRVPSPASLGKQGRKANLELLVKKWGLSAHDADLGDRENTAEALSEFVKSEGFEVFVKLELCYGGTAHDRLLRVGKLLDLVDQPVSLKAKDPLANELAQAVGRASNRRPRAAKRPRAGRSINIRVDGYALAELARRIEEHELTRFYTQTVPLEQLKHEQKLLDSTGRTVFRSHDYFVMRSSFPALRFRNLIGRKQGPPGLQGGMTLEHFRTIRDVVTDVIGNGRTGDPLDEAVLEKTLRECEGEFGNIATLIDDFKRLKFLSEVFLRWHLPQPMAAFVPFLKARLDSRAVVQETRESLRQNLSLVSRKLDETVGSLRDWKHDFVTLQRALPVIRSEWEVEPDPWRDLGLGRWGLELSLPEPVKERLAGWIEVVYRGDVSEERVSDLSLTIAAKDYESRDDFAVALCVLWALKLYGYIVREWEEAPQAWRNEVPAGLKVLYLVAKTRAVSKTLKDEPVGVLKQLEATVDDARQFCSVKEESPEQLEQAVGLMCLAHVAYWAWNRAREMGAGDAAKGFAEASFAASEAATRRLTEGSLIWAFSINHTAYMGVRNQIHQNRTEELLRRLGEMHEKLYHYRFADTRARAFTELVAEIVESHGVKALKERPSLSALRKGACENLEAAYNLLKGGGPWFGDLEVKRHRETLDDYRRSLRCSLS